jgi:hypothetical protein
MPVSAILDELGAVIPYGSRWGADGPPLDAYSRVSHPERFVPLIRVVEALIEWLTDTYEVRVKDDCADGLVGGPQTGPQGQAAGRLRTPRLVRTVAISPSREDSAPLVFLVTDFPSVEVMAGAFYRQTFPDCGCDACDDEWSGVAGMMEGVVLAVVQGTFSERLKGRHLETQLWYPGFETAGQCRVADLAVSSDDIAAGRRRLGALSNGWQPWPRSPSRRGIGGLSAR